MAIKKQAEIISKMQEELEKAKLKDTTSTTTDNEQSQMSESVSDGFFDVRKMLKLQETELKYNDLLFEIE